MRIVVISPSAVEREALEHLLSDDGQLVRAAATHELGLALAIEWRPDAIVADVQLGTQGRALVDALTAQGVTSRVVLLCPRAGCRFCQDHVVCLTKPIHVAELRRRLTEQARAA